MEITEFEFSVPWGVIGVKAWGDDKNALVLMVHGIQDNAGSYDRLIPHLPNSFYYVCIDLPGHGKSTHFPPYLPIITINYLIVYLYAMEYFGRDNYVIVGHSYGAQIGQLVAQLYPAKVSKLVMLDTLHLWMVDPDNFGQYLRDRLEHFIRFQKKFDDKNPPLYTYEEALDRIVTRRSDEIKEESVKDLLKRHLVPVGEKFKFSQDPRLACFINPLQDENYVLKLLKYYPLKCPVLIVLALGASLEIRHVKNIYKLMKNQPNISFVKVDGNHDVHTNEPQKVAPHVAKFLLNTRNKL